MKLSKGAIQNLCTEFAKYSKGSNVLKNADIDPIEDFLLIGAIMENGFLSPNDLIFLLMSVLKCRDLGIDVAPDFDVNVANIDMKHGGEDFLSGRYKADCLVSCFVYNGPKAEGYNCKHLKSDYSDIQNIWYHAAMRSNARFAFVFGDLDTEVTAQHFSGEDLIPLAANDNDNVHPVVRRDVLGALKL